MMLDLSGFWNLQIEKEVLTAYKTEIPELPDVQGNLTAGKVKLPGSLQAQGYGYPITEATSWISGLHDPFWYEREEYRYTGDYKVPFLAQPARHYLGRAWYTKTVLIPERAADKEYLLMMECTHWRSYAWINGIYKGSDCSLCTSHEINLGRLSAGSHTLAICIDNRLQYPYRPDGHGVSDALGATWNGIIGKIELLSVKEKQKKDAQKAEYAREHPRQIEVQAGMFLVDGKPEYFRGTHFGGDFPLTGYPVMEQEWWAKLFLVIKEWGLNFIRCHSYCPPEAAFAAADEAGIYIQAECGMWNVFEEGTEMLDVLKQETERILRQFGHHPSFVLFSPSNEPGGSWYKPLRRWVKMAKKLDQELGYSGRRLYTAQSGWFYDVPPEEVDGTDYIYFHRSGYGPMGGSIRSYTGWKGGDYSSSLKDVKLPVICHELGQWCAYPDFSVIEKFTGFLKPGNYEIFQENARASGLYKYAKTFAYCSGKLQAMMYKEDLEANFRTPAIYGFELLDLHDYLGQGTALVGVLDAFWHNKGYISPAEFGQSCGETVLLVRMSSYCYDRKPADIEVEVCHFGKRKYQNSIITWKLKDQTNTLASGSWKQDFIDYRKNQKIGIIHLDFSEFNFQQNKKLTLYLCLESENMTLTENQWDIYVYRDSFQDLLYSDDEAIYTRNPLTAKAALEEGKKVIYSPWLSSLDYECPSASIRPVFWNSQMGPGWERSLGMVIQKAHPIYKWFPTEEYGGWQWERILERARGFCLDALPDGVEPIVRLIDDWNRNLSLGLVFEGKVDNGKLLVVSASLEDSFMECPEAYALKQAIFNYVRSEAFRPSVRFSWKQLERHFFPVLRMEELVKTVSVPDACRLESLEALVQANPNVAAVMTGKDFPVVIEITLKEAIDCLGLYFLPDQKDRMREGCVKDYQIEVLEDDEYCEVKQGRLANTSKSCRLLFKKRVVTKSIKFIILSIYGSGPKTIWEETASGWYPKTGETGCVVKIGGLHIICEQEGPQSDNIFWKENRSTSTREIDN